MEALVLDGKKYTKVSKAARDLGYTSDYVGQLCRSGKVSAHLIGRSWYVDQEELSTHRTDKKRTSRVKAREQAKRTIKEHRTKSSTSRKGYTDIAISYENDSSELIPETRKITVDSEEVKQPKKKKLKKDTKKNIVENAGEKIIMHGSVSVVDVTEGVPDPHTTILTPTIVTKKKSKKHAKDTKPKTNSERKEIADSAEIAVESDGTENIVENKDFLEKLVVADVLTSREQPIEAQDEVSVSPSGHSEIPDTPKASMLPYVAIVLIVLVLVVMSLTLTLNVTYTAGSVTPVVEDIIADAAATVELIASKF